MDDDEDEVDDVQWLVHAALGTTLTAFLEPTIAVASYLIHDGKAVITIIDSGKELSSKGIREVLTETGLKPVSVVRYSYNRQTGAVEQVLLSLHAQIDQSEPSVWLWHVLAIYADTFPEPDTDVWGSFIDTLWEGNE